MKIIRFAHSKLTQHGFLILEAIIAIAILSMVLVTVLPSLNFFLKRARRSRNETQATLLLQEGQEVAYHVFASTTNWDLYTIGTLYKPVLTGPVGSEMWELGAGEDTGLETLFNRKIEIKAVCRHPATSAQPGEILDVPGCSESHGLFDPTSRNLITTVSWDEGGTVQTLTAKLLVTKQLLSP